MKKLLLVLYLKIENLHIHEGSVFKWILNKNCKRRIYFSVSHPFLGDYVRLRQNVQWKKICLETNDQYVVFADIINKIARSSGKVYNI